MFSRILVPLDGSELAESALEPASAIARAFAAEMFLVRVVPVPVHQRAGFSMGEVEAELAEADDYLASIASRMKEDDVKVHYAVRQGDVAEEILQHAADNDCDLIVICTHGRSGLARWVYGSIADRVLRYGLQSVPAILVVSAAVDK